jgi:hypothetical protein
MVPDEDAEVLDLNGPIGGYEALIRTYQMRCRGEAQDNFKKELGKTVK